MRTELGRKSPCLPAVIEDSVPHDWKFFPQTVSTVKIPRLPHKSLTPRPVDPAQAPTLPYSLEWCISLFSLRLSSFLLSPLWSLPSGHTPTIYPGQAHLLPTQSCPVVTLGPSTLSLLPQALDPQHTTCRNQLHPWFLLLTSPTPHVRAPRTPTKPPCASVSEHPGFLNATEQADVASDRMGC